MSRDEFFVSHQGQQIGPLGIEAIVNKVKSNELELMDYIFDSEKNDWVLLMEHQGLAAKLKDHMPAAPPKPNGQPKNEFEEEDKIVKEAAEKASPEDTHMTTEWYVLKGENKFGPFSYTDVVKMLQQKVVFEFDFAWRPGLTTWQRIADLESFDSGKIQQLQSTLMPEISEVFFRRRHRRVNYNGTILVHDNQSVWKGQGVEISAGGAGVVMENAMVVPGQTLYLHFKPGDGVPPFNAICEVVSKQYVDGVKEKNSPIRYGLKFTSISASTQKFLQEFTKRAEAA